VVLQLGDLGWGQQFVTIKNKLVMKCHNGPQTWSDSFDKQPELRKMDMRFGTWNVRSLYKEGSLMTVANEISKQRLSGSRGGQTGQR
jgi:hypothetical protein